ncbi:MAG: hypothetical protein CVV03_00350 [Firmicutes bacterium HGW-Firmicutes-8]|nr:MAG: hypothetical protein CVV03_00350 [Firmicutes bacterium HGW-Firmicutes-8]
MKQKLIYFIALLVILAGAIGPALYMHKTVSSNQPDKQVEISKTADYGLKEQGNTTDRSQTAASNSQVSSEVNKDQPAAETKQGSTAIKQHNSTSASISRETMPRSQVSNNSIPVVAPESGCKVGIAVVGESGEFLFGPAQVIVKKDNKWGITAMGALDAAGIPYAMKPTWPDFVDSISGQACRGVAGWMYNVNGDVPMHMADKHPVKTGDKVIWWYSKSMDQPTPQWDDLVQKK